MCSFDFHTVSVCWYPLRELNAQCNIPSVFLASFDARIVNAQNLIQLSKPVGLIPVTDTYLYLKSINYTLILNNNLLLFYFIPTQ